VKKIENLKTKKTVKKLLVVSFQMQKNLNICTFWPLTLDIDQCTSRGRVGCFTSSHRSIEKQKFLWNCNVIYFFYYNRSIDFSGCVSCTNRFSKLHPWIFGALSVSWFLINVSPIIIKSIWIFEPRFLFVHFNCWASDAGVPWYFRSPTMSPGGENILSPRRKYSLPPERIF